jgi:hypothetical protein
LNRTPVSPARFNSAISPKLEEIINKALEKNRDRRYQSAAGIRADLQRLKAREPAVEDVGSCGAPRRTFLMISVVLVPIVLGAIGLLHHHSSKARWAANRFQRLSSSC